MSTPPVPIFAREVGVDADALLNGYRQRRFVIPADAFQQIRDLPPGDPATEQNRRTYFSGESVMALDLVTMQMIRFRRATCGLLPCGCALEYWEANRTEPLPEPTVYDDLDWPGYHDLGCTCDGCTCGDCSRTYVDCTCGGDAA